MINYDFCRGSTFRIAVGITMLVFFFLAASASSMSNLSSRIGQHYSNAAIYSADRTLTDFETTVLSLFNIEMARMEGFPDIPRENGLMEKSHVFGMLDANGMHFEIINSSYLNVTLDSSEPIDLTLESAPEMVTMHIESITGAASAQIILGGFLPHTTYHKYEDDYHNHTAFTTSANGSYTYIQDLAKKHLIFIQSKPSTKFINDNATGGDCTLIGTWNSAPKTCTLTTDFTETIQIDSDGITLEGNGHIITGSNTSHGIYLSSRTGVTIKNLSIKHFYDGISLYSSSNNKLSGNNASNNNNGIILYSSSNNILSGNNASNNNGIILYSSSNNTLSGNDASNNNNGIILYSSSNNTLSGNNASNNNNGIFLGYSSNNTLINNKMTVNKYNFILFGGSDADFDNHIDTSNLVDGKPIFYIKAASNRIYDSSTSAGTFYCISCMNVTIKDMSIYKNGFGIFFWNTSHSRIQNVNVSINDDGISLYDSSNNTLIGNNASNNNNGIYLSSSSNNNILNSNNASNNDYGIYLSSSSNNKIFDNIFNNTHNFNFYPSNINTWNITMQSGINIIGGPYLGGNFWTHPNGTGFSQTCMDADRDGICDTNYTLASGNVDYLPLDIPPGFINGTVLNNGAGILGVIVNTNTNISTTTDSSGFYSLLVPPGAYNLTATKNPQYYPNSSVKVTVTTGTTLVQNIELLKKQNISACSTISSPGEYVLDQNILNSGTLSCINISSSNVIFEGAGYTIDGIDASNSYGVYVYNSTTVLKDVIVRNLNVTDWYIGIYNKNTHNGSIAKNNASNNNYGIYLDSARNNTVRNNTASHNWNSSPMTGGYGIFLNYSSNNTVRENTVSNNWNSSNMTDGYGIYLDYSNNNTLSDNNASKNFEGISLYTSNNNMLVGNNVLDNIYGIRLYGRPWYSSSNNNILNHNNASNNDYGIYLYYDSNNILNLNNASNNNYGIYLVNGKNNILRGNDAISISNITAIFLYGSSNNTLIGNNASNNGSGIKLVQSNNNMIVDNNASNNQYGCGIYLISSNYNMVIDNNASNAQYGNFLILSNFNMIIANNASNFYLINSRNNTIVGNKANSNNGLSISLESSSNNNIFYKNNIYSSVADNSTNNKWDNRKDIGNYYSKYDQPTEGCIDSAPKDGVCDSPYIIPGTSGSMDNYPLTRSGEPVNSSTGKGIVFFDSGTNTIENLLSVKVSDINEAPPADAYLYYGLFKFNITNVPNGSNAILTLKFPDNLSKGITYWKYGTNAANPAPHWYTIPSIINGNELTITLTDGGLGDDDITTNGRIKDDGGPSIPQFINGTVINNGTGIVDVIVTTNTSISTTTDSLGFYSLIVPPGTYNLTATKEPQYSPNSSAKVTVEIGTTVVQNIELLKKPVLTTIRVYKAINIIASNTQFFYSDSRDQYGLPIEVTVTWSSSNTTVGTIDNNGVFTGKATGTTIITAANGTIGGKMYEFFHYIPGDFPWI